MIVLMFFNWYSYDYTYSYGGWPYTTYHTYRLGLDAYMYGGFPGIVILFISYVALVKIRNKITKITGLLGSILLGINFIILFSAMGTIPSLQFYPPYFIGLICAICIIALNIFIHYVSKIDLAELNREKKPKKSFEQSVVDQVLIPEKGVASKFDSADKKRLYGMIKLRKEIDLEKAAEFFTIDAKQIEALLYDLAGDDIIQGRFEGNKFIIESNVDDFLSVLDKSFDAWESSGDKM